MTSPDTIIAEAFDRHCSELHSADYEVCEDALCQATYALERLYYPLYELVVAALEMSGVWVQKAEGKRSTEEWKQYVCGNCKFWNYGNCFIDNQNSLENARWWNAQACKELVCLE